MHQSRPRRTRYILIGLVFVILLVLVMVAVRWRERAETRRWRAEIDTRLDRIRACGQPVTSQDLARLYPDPPPDRDAVALLSPVLGQLTLPGGNDDSDLPFIGTNLPQKGIALNEGLKSKISTLVTDNTELLTKVSIDQLRGSWVGCGYASGFDSPSRFSMSQVGELVRVLCLESILEADRGDGSKAAQSLGRSFATLGILDSSVLKHHLGYRAYGGISCTTLEDRKSVV